ncbi:transporter substrate-binding domain-containing protein [Winogradskyella sp. DF17]|uniref:Transporter substrate-binding domain-containing protein n=1 Tax=Winogradskyella pelagia TaxID=2819984 RepID=A0ABS3T3X5_9FLAO|nr:transporter substrate-binding domain-containing protein [Winogradskyella sp. DF17]MBO3116979.1 transporter substrate-binding domain-containing protein [Winogradskyella sp. DF17]
MNQIRTLFYLLILCVLTSCRDSNKAVYDDFGNEISPSAANAVDRDLKAIKKEGVLRALVVYSSTSYFLYKGQAMGFEYELLNQLANDLGLKLELVISDNLDSQFEVLNRGDVDLIAHGMTVTNQRKWEVDFTDYLYLTKQVLVQKKPDNFRRLSWKSLHNAIIHDPIELINDTVSIRKNSAYYERLVSLSNEIGGTIHIDTLDSKLSTGEIMDMVADGKIKYTIADENLAKINASSRPILDISVPISFSQRIAWVTRKKSKDFRRVVNEWIISQRKKKHYNVIYNKYFKNKRSFRRRTASEYYSLKNNQISAYDEMLKAYAQTLGWDWRLLAAQVYQESKFDPKASSWAGAQGLMQVMPATAESLGIKNISDPAESLRGGTTYLSQIYDQFNHINDSLNRVKLTLAAYNCGLGHLQDAQRLAEENGLNPKEWNDVADMLLELRYRKNYNKPFIKYGYVRGTEPVTYVNQIFERYEHYNTFIELENQ